MADTLRVKLLSSAQHKQAAATKELPQLREATSDDPGSASSNALSTISIMPRTIRPSAFSWNTTQAKTAVSTASKLSSKEAVDAGVNVSPNIKAKGPNTPPNPMASSSHNHSARGIVGIHQLRSRASLASPRPIPLPRYSRPASKTGGVSCSSAFASGVLAPNNAAAPRAA
nr:hypothetical protein [Candidatus Nitrosoglobus terrae]